MLWQTAVQNQMGAYCHKNNIISPLKVFPHVVRCLLVLLLPHLIEHPVFHKGWHKSMGSGEFHRNKQFL